MKTKSKIIYTTILTMIVVGATVLVNMPMVSHDVLGQLNNANDLTTRDYHVEKTVLLWLIDAIISAVIWTRKEKKVVVRKEVDFDFLNYKGKKGENYEK